MKSRCRSALRARNRNNEEASESSACGRRGESIRVVKLASSSGCECFSVACTSVANIQLSKKNISPSSLLIFLTPIGFSLFNLACTSKLLLTRSSSSGKYFMCFGKLCGHCSSAAHAVSRRRERIAGGRASRFVYFMVIGIRL